MGPAPRQLDVLHVSLGTTFGARRGDSELISALRELGLRAEQLRVDLRPVERLRNRTPPLTDLSEAAAVRVALDRALERRGPRAIVYSATTSALLQPAARLRIPSAVWMDAPAASNRPGGRNCAQRALERRYMRSIRLLIGKARRSCDVLREMAPPGVPVVRLPVPLGDRPFGAASGAGIPPRYAITYAGSPHKKGLDLVAAAWRAAAPELPLLVSGLARDAGASFLRERNLHAPSSWVWLGSVPRERHRALIAGADAYVAASRVEEFGQAQLEALADGVPLVTLPSAGTYEALAPARRLDGRLVAADLTAAALAPALRAGLALGSGERASYARRARAETADYTRDAFLSRLESRVLPLLLGPSAIARS